MCLPSSYSNLIFEGLNSPVPRGGRKPKKSKSKEGRSFGQNNVDKDHWSNAEKYDGDFYLEPTYKKHLLRHANKSVLISLLPALFLSLLFAVALL